MNESPAPSSQDSAAHILAAALESDHADRGKFLERSTTDGRALTAEQADPALAMTLPMPRREPPATTKPSASHDTSELPLPEELQVMLGESYIVESFIGQGGMGAVCKGLQMPLRRPVAIKILAKCQAGEEDEFAFEERFKREAYAMATLTHPHIVQVYDCGDAGEHHLFISMELLQGGDLSDAIKAGRLTTEAALKLIPQICAGIQAAHDRGLVHGDIKPANIFLTMSGGAKVADFGLAKRFDAQSNFTDSDQAIQALEFLDIDTPSAAADGWEDLFAQLTPEFIAQNGKGGWQREGGVLRSPEK